MTQQELNAHLKANVIKNIPSTLHRKTSLPEWLELLHDELASNTDMNSLLFLQLALSVKDYDKLKSAFFVYLMQENKTIVQGLYSKYDDKVNKQVEDVLDMAISVYSGKYTKRDLEKLQSAANSAYSAYSTAYSAAYSDANSAAHSAANSAAHSAANSAYSAANSAAHSAANSAYSAAYSAYSAAYSAYSTAYSAAHSAANSAYSAANSAYSAANSAANSAHSAANSAAYKKHAGKLMELLDKC